MLIVSDKKYKLAPAGSTLVFHESIDVLADTTSESCNMITTLASHYLLHIILSCLQPSLQSSPFVMLNTTEDGSVNFYGICIDMLKELAKTLNFT